jgi:hypothetical protein
MTDKIPAVGSKLLVFRGLARHTSGGLKKSDLMRHKGRIISRKKHAQGLKSIKHLKSLGYVAKKGTFKLFRKSDAASKKKRHTKKRHTRRRGGAAGVPAATSGTGLAAGAHSK